MRQSAVYVHAFNKFTYQWLRQRTGYPIPAPWVMSGARKDNWQTISSGSRIFWGGGKLREPSLPPISLCLPSQFYLLVTVYAQALLVVVWRSGSALVSSNEVNIRKARLVLGWVTTSGFKSRCRTCISVCDQPPRSIQPGHRFVGGRNEYQLKGGESRWRLAAGE